MDIELLRTFLAVTQARHFGKAAENLFLTPAAVSARIRQLEHTLGTVLFHRTRGNIQMTSAGEKLLPHATKMLAAWVEAQADLSLKPEPISQLRVGGINGLWPLLEKLLDKIDQNEHLTLSLESHSPAELLNKLADQRLDMALMLDIPAHPDIKIVEISELTLGLFHSTSQDSDSVSTGFIDIHMDWGLEFASKQLKQLKHLSEKPVKSLYCNDLQLTLDWMRKAVCRAYLPIDLVPAPSGFLDRVSTAPVVHLPAYLVYRTTSEHAALLEVLINDRPH